TRGPYGSAKTPVASHRIAYPAYDDPAIDWWETLFVVFSPALGDYVSHVLPALHVPRVHVTTFEEWARVQVRRLYPRLPRQLREHTPAAVQRFKLHPALLAALAEHVRRV